jgi:isopenicillin N synthase-like dioxygenase
VTAPSLSTAPGAASTTSAVPIIDLAPFFSGSSEMRRVVADEVGAACRSIGFLVVTGHGVPADAISDVYDATKVFFALPQEEKLKIAGPAGDAYTAYSPQGDPYATQDGTRPNLREAFHASRYDTPAEAIAGGYPADVVASMPPNKWPEKPAEFEAAWKRYFAEMELLSGRLLHIFATALELPEDWFDDKVDRHLGTMAANCYVEQPVPPAPGQFRSRAHVDFSTLTILYQDDAPGGLQVHHRGAGWLDVPPVPGSYVVNLGDLMGRWTNDQWVATPHRVANPPAELAMTRRFSLPFFHLPNHDAVIEPIPTCVTASNPARYVPVLAGEWTAARREGRSANFGRVAPAPSVASVA